MKTGITLFAICTLGALAFAAQKTGNWQSEFPVEKKTLGTAGENPYFNLTPGLHLEYRNGNEVLVSLVLNETKMVDGVETRVVEDRETKNGQLVELTRDYFAIDKASGDVYYFGEDGDVYKNGKIVSHEGAWLSGVNGAKFGLLLPGKPQVGQRFYNELAPGVGRDRAEIISLNEAVTTPAGRFEPCLRLRETSAIEKALSDHKWFAPGVGMVKDGKMVLVKLER
jgi:hypothetical protein